MAMSKVDFINLVAENLNSEVAIAVRGKRITKSVVTEVVNELLDTLVDVVEDGEEGDGVNFTGYFSVQVVKAKARTGRNPQNGEVVPIPERLRVKLIPKKNLKDAKA